MTLYDVAVVGGGPAGLAAACAAAETGAKVVLLETLDVVGGNAVWSTGYLAFVDVPFQRERGIQDSVEQFMIDAGRQFALHADKAGMIWDESLTRMFALESAATYDQLVSLGVEFSRVIQRPLQHGVDRLLALDDPTVIGPAYRQKLEELGVDLLFGADVQRLLTENGRVIGLQARMKVAGQQPELVVIGVRKAVVLACGGYQANLELRRRHQPERQINKYIVGLGTCRGSGHVLGASLGGDLINMGFIQPMVLVPSLLIEDAIAVNLIGERFHDEAGPYDQRVGSLLRQPEGKGFYIVDGQTLVDSHALIERMPEPPVLRDSLADVARAIGCDPDGLVGSANRWNGFLSGNEAKDPDFGRVILPVARRKLMVPPFAAIPMVQGISFTWGGLVVTLDLQVVTVLGECVPGLFAAGDTIGGLNVVSSMGGLHISGALTLGRIAGRAAASGSNMKRHLPSPAEAPTLPRSDVRMALVQIDAEHSGSHAIEVKR